MRLALLCVLSAMGCAKSTEILVVVSSDLDIPAEANALSLAIKRADDGTTIYDGAYALPGDATLPASLDLHGSDGAPSITVDARLNEGATLKVERLATLPFATGRSIELRIGLDRDCVGVICPNGLTCVAAACVAPGIDSTQLPDVSPDPFAPDDLRPPVGPPPRSNDLSMSDLTTTMDAAAPCGQLLLPPSTGDDSCTIYVFTSGLGTSTPSPVVTANGATYDYTCGSLNVSYTGGDHSMPGTRFHVDFPMVPGTHVTSVGVRNLVVQAGTDVGLQETSSQDPYIKLQMEKTIDAQSDSYEVDFTSREGPPVAAAMSGTHTFALTQATQVESTPTYYSALFDGAPTQNSPYTSVYIPLGVTPSFYVETSGNPVSVSLDYVEVCPN